MISTVVKDWMIHLKMTEISHLPLTVLQKYRIKALVLSGDKSYVETPIEQLGNGNALSFDITLSSEPESGDILFESDAAYGTHDIRIMSNGKLGFTRNCMIITSIIHYRSEKK